jgi:hypothetical protein
MCPHPSVRLDILRMSVHTCPEQVARAVHRLLPVDGGGGYRHDGLAQLRFAASAAAPIPALRRHAGGTSARRVRGGLQRAVLPAHLGTRLRLRSLARVVYRLGATHDDESVEHPT